MRIYVCGPMTGLPNYNFDEFNRVSRELAEAGHEVYNPATSFKGKQDLPYDTYLRHAVQLVSMCDGLVLLPGWNNSRGALTEVHVALSCDIDLFLWEDRLLISYGLSYQDLTREMVEKYGSNDGNSAVSSTDLRTDSEPTYVGIFADLHRGENRVPDSIKASHLSLREAEGWQDYAG